MTIIILNDTQIYHIHDKSLSVQLITLRHLGVKPLSKTMPNLLPICPFLGYNELNELLI